MKTLFLWDKVLFNVEECFIRPESEVDELSKLLKRKPCWPSRKHPTIGAKLGELWLLLNFSWGSIPQKLTLITSYLLLECLIIHLGQSLSKFRINLGF